MNLHKWVTNVKSTIEKENEINIRKNTIKYVKYYKQLREERGNKH